MDYDIVTWKIVDEAIESISDKIKLANASYDFIYGIPRGGLVPAVMLSHALKIPLILNLEEVWRLKSEKKSVLIIDDISDTGSTLMYFKNEGFDIATLYTRVHTTKTVAKYNAFEVNHNDWLLFPWETKNSSC